MENSKSSATIDTVYLDNLSFSAFMKLLLNRGLKRIIVLGPLRPWQIPWRWMLQRKGMCVSEGSFFAGHLRTSRGESIFMATRRLAGETVLSAAKGIVESEPQLSLLNKKYGRNTIRLIIAKQLHLHIEYWILRALIAQALCVHDRVLVWLKEPYVIEGGLVKETLPDIDIQYYPVLTAWPFKNVVLWISAVARYIKQMTYDFGKPYPYSCAFGAAKSSVLLLKEEDIHGNPCLRGQPHWVNTSKTSRLFETYIVDFNRYNFTKMRGSSDHPQADVHMLPSSIFRSARYALRKNKLLKTVRQDMHSAYWTAFKVRGYMSKHALLRVAFSLKQAEMMGALALWTNTRVFLVSEIYYSFSNAMLLVAPKLGITTIAYQYSNMSNVTPSMMSTVDKCLLFSEMYKKIYKNHDIGPMEFHVTGYLFDGIDKYVKHKSRIHRETLESAGAKFIVCYFDESVQYNRWGMVSKKDHLGELHALARMVVTDPTFAVVVKSQFMRNSPSHLYPGDKLISQAMKTGRYMELKKGNHRNNVYPTEAALTADLCIGHKFGATAALEAAIAGVRTVLLDSCGMKILWDPIYSKADIEYRSMGAILDAVKKFREGCSEKETLGDWGAILHYFDTYHDGRAIERMRNIINRYTTTKKEIEKH